MTGIRFGNGLPPNLASFIHDEVRNVTFSCPFIFSLDDKGAHAGDSRSQESRLSVTGDPSALEARHSSQARIQIGNWTREHLSRRLGASSEQHGHAIIGFVPVVGFEVHIFWLTSKMSHAYGRRAACRTTTQIRRLHFETPSVARGV